MVMVDACGSAATETVASISSHVTRVSMYFAVGIGCLPLKLIVRRVVRRVPMMPQAIVPVPSVLEKGSKRAREASDGTQKVQLRVHILYYRFPRAKSEWLVSTRSSWYCRPRASPKLKAERSDLSKYTSE
ncbi:hypothetical protein HZH66_001002 [Vespula vulgaris]|uniref:Uncharacterized protein n=1 Tax=Vespula vulgaris TaxID=7454 RepID=A0A834KU88_VESVU|nr:hypothetical protein HZH66_001002 [Vespula vulgaris]